MSAIERWVLDASTADDLGGVFAFCPIEGDPAGEYSIIFGLTFLGASPPGGEFVGVVHDDGQEAVEAWCADHAADLERIKEEMA